MWEERVKDVNLGVNAELAELLMDYLQLFEEPRELPPEGRHVTDQCAPVPICIFLEK